MNEAAAVECVVLSLVILAQDLFDPVSRSVSVLKRLSSFQAETVATGRLKRRRREQAARLFRIHTILRL